MAPSDHPVFTDGSESIRELLRIDDEDTSVRKSKGKLIALLSGIVVLVLVAASWKGIYSYLLTRQIIGRWERHEPDRQSVEPWVLEFDSLGEVHSADEETESHYRVDGDWLLLTGRSAALQKLAAGFTKGSEVLVEALFTYRIEKGDFLTVTLAADPRYETAFRRVSEDS